jgi:hypothetical protein
MAVPGAAFAQAGPDEPATRVATEAELRSAWADLTETHIELTDDIYLHQCKTGDPIRESPYPMLLDGKGHTIRQTCFEKRVLRQDGTGRAGRHQADLHVRPGRKPGRREA